MAFLQRTMNRGSVSTGYDIDNSLKLEEDNSEYLERATGGGNGSTTQHTISVWVKRTELAKTSFILGFAHIGRLRFESDDKIEYQFRSGRKIETNRLFRDTSAWYHIVVVADSTLATSTDRMKLYINGVRETDLLTYVAQDQNQGSPAWGVYNTYNYRIGYSGNAGENFNGYIADAYYINGQTLDPTDFGEFDEDTGIWKPKEFTGTFGSLDNYLNFSNSSNLGEDANGGTDLSSNNITSADQATDTPTNNFCTLNVIANIENNAVVFTEGATVGSVSGGGNVSDHAMATMGFSSGKWYYEAYVTTGSTNDDAMFGFANTNGWYQGLGNYTFSAGAHNVGRWYYNSNTYTTTGATAWDKGDIVQIAIDCDNGKCWSGVNGTYSSGDPSTNTGGFDWDANVTDMSIGDLVIPVTRVLYTAPGTTYYNFGGYTLIPISSAASDANGYGTFEYAPPTGFYAICGKNLAEYGGTA